MMPQPQNDATIPGYVRVEIPPLSLTFTGRAPIGADHPPVSMFFVDDPTPESFRHLDLVERAALRALAAATIDSLDLYESVTRDDA